MRLSKDFHLYEFERSSTATRLGIDNKASNEIIGNIQALVDHVLQPLRDLYDQSIRIASGYRCPTLNSIIGGAQHSQHMTGDAADIDTERDNLQLFNLIVRGHLPFDQLIWEFGQLKPEWIHVSYAGANGRGQILRAYRDDHGVHYSPFIYGVQ